jgi:hypothetical protein
MPKKLPENLFAEEIGKAAIPVLKRVKRGEISGEEAVNAVLEAIRDKATAAVDTIWFAEGEAAATKKAKKTPES